MKYPDNERILIVRPCLKAICLGVRSASKLLSVLLYRARNCKEDETTFTFTCTQVDLVNDLCEELTTKQLHDMAIPVLQLLGYLDVNGSGFRHTYTVHLDKVQEALACYKNKEVLELLLISFIYKQLEEVPMELELVPIQLEEVLKHLELLLKTIGKSSNCKRGRKPRPQAALEATSENVDSNRDITDSITDKRDSGANAPTRTNETSYHIDIPAIGNDAEEDEETARRPAITLNGHVPVSGSHDAIGNVVKPLHTTMPSKQKSSEQTPGPGALPPSADPPVGGSSGITRDQATPSLLLGPEPVQSSPPTGSVASDVTRTAQATGKPDKPKRVRKNEAQLTLHEQEIKAWYEELRGVEILLSKRNVTALAALGKRKMSKDDFLSVTAILDSDKWFEEHKIGVDLFWIERQWENKIIFLRRKHGKRYADTDEVADDDYSITAMLKLQERRERRATERGV